MGTYEFLHRATRAALQRDLTNEEEVNLRAYIRYDLGEEPDLHIRDTVRGPDYD